MAVGRCDICGEPAPYRAETSLQKTIPVDDLLAAFVLRGPVLSLCRQHAEIAKEKWHTTVTTWIEQLQKKGR